MVIVFLGWTHTRVLGGAQPELFNETDVGHPNLWIVAFVVLNISYCLESPSGK